MCASEAIEHRKNSWELYGFDYMVSYVYCLGVYTYVFVCVFVLCVSVFLYLDNCGCICVYAYIIEHRANSWELYGFDYMICSSYVHLYIGIFVYVCIYVGMCM